MSIRLRRVDGALVALCAARSVEKPGDRYLDDEEHHALYVKFDLDICSERNLDPLYADSKEAVLTAQEESNNPNREWWDSIYAPVI